ncbi:MAG: AsmA family protein [Desulfobacterales bacterium]|nr:AsmA family protein [Desulfobacterales bacterium]
MKKGMKTTGIVILSAFVFVMAAAFILPYLISLDKYKGMVEEKLEQALKRDVSLGRLRVTILPTLGAKIENMVISNPPEFSKTPLLSLDSLKVRVKIIPLLFGRKEIAGLTLTRPVVFIEKNPQGRLNIPYMEEAGKTERKGTLESGTIKTDESQALQGLYLAKASIKDGNFIYLDRSANPARRTEIERIDLDLRDLSLDKKIRYNLSLQWSPGEISLAGWVGPLGKTIDLKDIPLEGSLLADFPDLGAFMKKLSGGQENTIEGALKAGLNFGGNVGSSIKVKGEVLLKRLSLGEKGARAIEDLDIALRPEADLSKGANQLRINAALQIDKTSIVIDGQFKDLQGKPAGKMTFSAPQGINLADVGPKFPSLNQAAKLKGIIAFTGDLIVPAQGTPLLSLEANSSRIEVTLAEQKKGAQKETPAQKKPTGEKQTAQRIPLDGRGKVTVKEGKFQGSDFHNFLLTAEMKGGDLKITRFTCGVFGGTVEGDGSYTMAQEPSPFRMKTRVTGVDANALLSSLASAKGMMKGKLNGEVALGGAGFSLDTLKKNLTGTGNFQIKDGELTALNLVSNIVQALGGKGGSKEKTTFDDLTSSFTIQNGMVTLPNILISLKDTDLKLQGNIGLDSTLKMEGEAHLPSSVTGDLSGKGWRFFADNKGRLTIPFTLTGAVTDPKVGISTKFVEQGVKGVLQEFMKKKHGK